jgi:O-methyltransferase
MRFTLLRRKRLRLLKKAAQKLTVPGAFVELGSWRGGSAATFIQHLGQIRDCWLFDSFEGMPEPTEYDTAGEKHANDYKHLGMPDDDTDTYEICFNLMDNIMYPNNRIHIIQGWFEDTFPIYADEIDKIAVLHVDCDWYESVKLSLETFYDKVVPGGIVILDDYGHWDGARKAVDEFIEKHGLKVDLTRVDSTGYYFKKA